MKGKRGLLLVLIAMLLAFPITVYAADQTTTSSNNTIVAGTSYIDMSIKISQKGWTSSNNAIIASYDDFPDALGGASLGVIKDCPIFYANKNGLDTSILTELKRLNVKNVYILGGSGAVSSKIEGELVSDGYIIKRLAGNSRFETAISIGNEIVNSGKTDTVYIANAYNFADALSGAVFAGEQHAPILLTAKDSLSVATIQALKNWGITKAYVLGGSGVVSQNVLTELGKLNIKSTVLAGGNRYETSQSIVKQFDKTLDKFTVVTGKDYHNPLIAVSYSAKINQPIVLMDNECDTNIKSFIANKNLLTIGLSSSLKTYTSSDYLKSEYINISFITNEKINVKGKCRADKTGFMFIIENQDGSSILNENRDIKSSGTYDEIFTLNKELKDGNYKLSVFIASKGDGTYWGYYCDIPVKVQQGDVSFSLSSVYKANCIEYDKFSNVNTNDYLNIDIYNKKHENELKSLADEIVKGSSSNYEKILKIHDWVSDNIYYNWDGYISDNVGAVDPYGTFINKMSVCQGYAELTNVLIRMEGIPCRVVSGYAIWVDSQSWETVNHAGSNHAWNEAFVDGRWVIIDTTWDSGNKYENGKFNKKDSKHLYFDITLKSFSLDHEIKN